jgi:hypothetical protein
LTIFAIFSFPISQKRKVANAEFVKEFATSSDSVAVSRDTQDQQSSANMAADEGLDTVESETRKDGNAQSDQYAFETTFKEQRE